MYLVWEVVVENIFKLGWVVKMEVVEICEMAIIFSCLLCRKFWLYGDIFLLFE